MSYHTSIAFHLGEGRFNPDNHHPFHGFLSNSLNVATLMQHTDDP